MLYIYCSFCLSGFDVSVSKISLFSSLSQAKGALGDFVHRELSAVAGAVTITCLMVCLAHLKLKAIIYLMLFLTYQ